MGVEVMLISHPSPEEQRDPPVYLVFWLHSLLDNQPGPRVQQNSTEFPLLYASRNVGRHCKVSCSIARPTRCSGSSVD